MKGKVAIIYHSADYDGLFSGASYDRGRFTCRDGSRYTRNGAFVATRLVPLGTRLVLRYKGKEMELVVRDTPAKRFGKRLDLPDGTWERITGAKRPVGLVRIEWRVK